MATSTLAPRRQRDAVWPSESRPRPDLSAHHDRTQRHAPATENFVDECGGMLKRTRTPGYDQLHAFCLGCLDNLCALAT